MRKFLTVATFVVLGVFGTAVGAQDKATKKGEVKNRSKTKKAFKSSATMKVKKGKDFSSKVTVYVAAGQNCDQEGKTDTNTTTDGYKTTVKVPGGSSKKITCDLKTTFECKEGTFVAIKAETLNCAFDDPVIWSGNKIVDFLPPD